MSALISKNICDKSRQSGFSFRQVLSEASKLGLICKQGLDKT